MSLETRLTFDGAQAYVETDDPTVTAQLEELDEAESVGPNRFALPAAIARLHFPHLPR